MFSLNEDVFIPLFIFAIPIVAITGGITVAIVRAIGRQRVIELAQRERIAAIERGVDPTKLPPLNLLGGAEMENILDFTERQGTPLRRAQSLMIGGLVTLFAGVGITIFLLVAVSGGDREKAWAVGLIPAFVGAALLISSKLVWPRNGAPRP